MKIILVGISAIHALVAASFWLVHKDNLSGTVFLFSIAVISVVVITHYWKKLQHKKRIKKFQAYSNG